ncbi:MAG: DEAD/DEAH box helicase [Aeoliella sp.]
MSFESLGLSPSVLRAVREEGYETASPIQSKAIPSLLEGRDLMGCAQKGTGKTAAFALPTLHLLGDNHRKQDNRGRGQANKRGSKKSRNHSRNRNRRVPDRPVRTLVLAPTRELAVQVAESFATYGRFTGLRTTTIFGGVSQRPQVTALEYGVDIVVATPGRLLDLMNQGHVDLSKVEILILDEADQMLDMGFLPDLRKIVDRVPKGRQTLMFSATMPDEIRRLASAWLRKPEHVQVTPVSSPVEAVKQSVYFVDSRHKPQLPTHYLNTTGCERTLVFARTKHGADKIVKHLGRSGIRAAAIHGNKSQGARTRTLEQFKSQRPPVLVATDIAARGLDVDAVSHVINYELPEIPEIYVHRIGRTGRAGASGIATSFCGGDERSRLKRIERLTRRSIEVEQNQPKFTSVPSPTPQKASQANGAGSRRRKPKGQTGKKGQTGSARPHARKTEGQQVGTKSKSSKGRRQKQRPRRGAQTKRTASNTSA